MGLERAVGEKVKRELYMMQSKMLVSNITFINCNKREVQSVWKCKNYTCWSMPGEMMQFLGLIENSWKMSWFIDRSQSLFYFVGKVGKVIQAGSTIDLLTFSQFGIVWYV